MAFFYYKFVYFVVLGVNPGHRTLSPHQSKFLSFGALGLAPRVLRTPCANVPITPCPDKILADKWTRDTITLYPVILKF